MTWEEAVIWLRSQPDQAQLVKDCFYDDPLTAAAERYFKSTEWQAVRKLLPRPPGRALDLGAGRGISSYALAREGWNVVALEPDPSGIVGTAAIRRLASESGLSIRVVEAWGERLPFPDQAFDVVYCRQVLHHASDLNQLCREISRILKKDGIFIATREHVISKRKDLSIFLANHPLHHLCGGEHAYTLKEYRSAIEGGGLTIRKMLAPRDSDINLFPLHAEDLKRRLAGRIGYILANRLLEHAMTILNILDRTPGRLYSFVAKK